MNQNTFPQETSIFNGRQLPEKSVIVGYAAIITTLNLSVPIPETISIISSKNRIYTLPGWNVFTIRYQPEESLQKQLQFALKYEGINLLFFKKLFKKLTLTEIEHIIHAESAGIYGRKIWFLYEWLMGKKLNLDDADVKIKYSELLDEKLQYGIKDGEKSSRHRIINNLPGTVDFCPLVYKTAELENYISLNLAERTNNVLSGVRKDILLRTSAFLLLKDSKASFTIEGENPSQNRALRWGRAIGQAGNKDLTKEELLRLQQIIIENSRFTQMGYRTDGGFIGEHSRGTGEPIPDHISAKWEDLEILMNGLITAAKRMETHHYNPILTAANIAFGFVFIHPLVDGNGRLHRYLIHHLLATMKFAPQGIVFPVSAAILDRIADYRKVLENYSHPLLDFIEWKKTDRNNVTVVNDTIDYYRYFDATVQSTFLFECVDYTINKIIPEEVDYLQKYDAMKRWIDNRFQMPDNTAALLIRFLEQNSGLLSRRAKEKEFNMLTVEEIEEIESNYKIYFEVSNFSG